MKKLRWCLVISSVFGKLESHFPQQDLFSLIFFFMDNPHLVYMAGYFVNDYWCLSQLLERIWTIGGWSFNWLWWQPTTFHIFSFESFCVLLLCLASTFAFFTSIQNAFQDVNIIFFSPFRCDPNRKTSWSICKKGLQHSYILSWETDKLVCD